MLYPLFSGIVDIRPNHGSDDLKLFIAISIIALFVLAFLIPFVFLRKKTDKIENENNNFSESKDMSNNTQSQADDSINTETVEEEK